MTRLLRLLRFVLLTSLFLALAVGGLVTLTVDPPPPKRSFLETVLKPRETLEMVLVRSGLSRSEAAGIIAELRDHVNMRRIRPGERVLVTRAPDGTLLGVTYSRSQIERYEIGPTGGGWSVRKVVVPVQTRVDAVTGTIENSLFVSMDKLNERPALAAKFVNLFEWDFDFAAESLPGDRFRLLVEKRFAHGELLGYGHILLAQYWSTGRRPLTAARFEVAKGKSDYFDAKGRSVRKMFLRAPLDFTRITSGYSHARRHPILGGVRPHLAIDYSAPAGTPVRAVADGVVQSAGWKSGNGLRITLRHKRGYKTMYNHLSKIHVRRGQRVRQRDIIGRVGSTGLSTGPHLDYRVIKNGRFVNPLSEKFIPGDPVPAGRRRAFRKHLELLLRRLDAQVPLDSPAATGQPGQTSRSLS